MPLTKEEKEFVEEYFKTLKKLLCDKIAEMVAEWVTAWLQFRILLVQHMVDRLGGINAVSK